MAPWVDSPEQTCNVYVVCKQFDVCLCQPITVHFSPIQSSPVHWFQTPSSAERHYSQLEKEALAIVFAVKKFHSFLYWWAFLIKSDHRPLMFLFGEKSGVPQVASSHIQHWALTLSYHVQLSSGETVCWHVDALHPQRTTVEPAQS